MARRAKGTTFDPKQSYSLTNQIIADLSCPDGLDRVNFRDSVAPALQVRVSSNGRKVFVFERKWKGETVRKKIGTVGAMTLHEAREVSRTAYAAYDMDIDYFKAREEELNAKYETVELNNLRGCDVWAEYVNEKSTTWSARNTKDHLNMAEKGGGIRKRAPKVNGIPVPKQAGLLYDLLQKPLNKWDDEAIERLVFDNRETRPGRLRLALRLLSGFVGWCNSHRKYRDVLPEAHKLVRNSRINDLKGSPTRKTDVLKIEELPSFFNVVRSYLNPYVGAYLQVMLLTGGRPNEIRSLRWENVNFERGYIFMRDKVEGNRQIPLTPYVAHVLRHLPQINGWVFASPNSYSGRMCVPTKAFTLLCKRANIDHCTLHGLRRSFATLTDWMDEKAPPSGVVPQIMGHKPSATAEKHYKVRPLAMLRKYHVTIEQYLLVHANISPDPATWPAPSLYVGLPKENPFEDLEDEFELDATDDDNEVVGREGQDSVSELLDKMLLENPEPAVEEIIEPEPEPVPVPVKAPVQIIVKPAKKIEVVPAKLAEDPDIDHELFFGTPKSNNPAAQQGSLF